LTEIEDDDDLDSYVQRSKEQAVPIVYFGLPPEQQPLAPQEPQPCTSQQQPQEKQMVNLVEEPDIADNENGKLCFNCLSTAFL